MTISAVADVPWRWHWMGCCWWVLQVLAEVDLTRVADSQIGGGAFYVTKGQSVPRARPPACLLPSS